MSKEFPEITTGFNAGGYPLMYVGDGIVLCGKCASKAAKSVQVTLEQRTHWEGSPVSCDECGVEIESAYGDPNEDN